MSSILDNLNIEQQKAAKHIDGPLLILAGAGSGKTTTIVSRLSYLINEVGILASNTLTLTFTNKAASEMRDRALSMIHPNSHPPLLCTFHKFGLILLKFHIEKLGRKNNFVIIDSEDKKRIIKQFNSKINASIISYEISHYKNSLLSSNQVLESAELKYDKELANIYLKYEAYISENNLVDFDDLLKLPYEILENNPDIAQDISQRYKYIMVDEYQDTNELQFKFLQKLCTSHQNLCVVGDDDQSIYGWRGANIRNILEFDTFFENVKTTKLQINYRSSNQILKIANDLIKHNRNRLDKTLISANGDAEKVKLFISKNENEESYYIAKAITSLLNKGVSPSEIAILYRINALSRSIEEGLTKANIRYQMLGGIRFYDRAEIKDLISYFRLLSNIDDDFSIKRIINKPKRGIGKISLEKLENSALQNQQSIAKFIETINDDDLKKLIGNKAGKGAKNFIDTILEIQTQNNEIDFIEQIELKFNIKTFYQTMPEGEDKIANIEEFYGFYRDYFKNNTRASLVEFLNEISLQSEQDNINNESIHIMSIHASKGLEFGHVYIIGFEEKFLPIIGETSSLEEERRLAYVAITRAKHNLTLCSASSRFYKGRREDLIKSRFLKETGLIEGSFSMEKSSEFKKGDIIKHKIFGMGRIIGIAKAGKDYKLNINFGGNQRDILSSFVEKL
jgi:DNA helicase-2/ATP-dependent DNA helicase PcrA